MIKKIRDLIGEDMLGYIADTWLLYLMILAMLLVFICAIGFWSDGELSTGKAILIGLPALLIALGGICGTGHYYTIHFCMSEEELKRFIAKIHREIAEEKKQKEKEKPGADS